MREATREEVESALIEEAKRRGYKTGVTIIDARDKRTEEIAKNNVQYEKTYGWELIISTSDHTYCVLMNENGEWATIVEGKPVKEVTMEDVIKKFGYEVKIIK